MCLRPSETTLTNSLRGYVVELTEEAAKVRGLVVGGRLGAYRYLDMDKAVAAALNLDIEAGTGV